MDLLRRALLALSAALMLLGVALVGGAMFGVELNPFAASPESREVTLLTGIALFAVGLFLLPSGLRLARRRPQDDDAEDGAGW